MHRPLRTALGLLAAATAPSLAAAQRAAAQRAADPCPSAGTQAALTRCADSVARAADAALNAVYRVAYARAAGPRRVLLRDAQRRWIAFRDAHCADEAGAFAGGSAYPMQRAFCVASVTDARRAQLEARVDAEASR